MQRFCYHRTKKIETLIDFLSRRFAYNSRERWEQAIDEARVKVDEKKSFCEKILITGNWITYERRQEEEPAIDPQINILHEDADFLVVEKNGNLPISPSGKYFHNCLINLLQREHGFSNLHAVHRLDRETSGLLVIAKGPKIAESFRCQFSAGKPEKIYHALLQGQMRPGPLLMDQPLGKVDFTPGIVSIRQILRPDGKQAQTEFNPIKIKAGLTLVKINLFTGRSHQIRAHAQAMGHPILGDKLYGQTDSRFIRLIQQEEEPLFEPWGKIDHQLLHASKLSFDHPNTEQRLSFSSDFMPFFSRFAKIKAWLNQS